MTEIKNKQAKVSMVMPCYNKVDYISEMLDSVIAQKWDNIELVMVNDGSTDGTREIIENYIPKLKARGFDVIVVDQENAGVCAAGKNGLSRITGDYVCQVDCDDELDPEYVNIPVSFLELHPDYDYTACHLIKYQGQGENKEFVERELRPIQDGCETLCEMYLTERAVMPVWVYMVRASYLHECGIPDNYYTDTKGSHEPGYVIPLTAGNGKVKYFPLPLYRFNFNGEGHSRFTRFEQAVKFYDEYLRLMLIAVERLGESVAEERKARLVHLCNLHRYLNLYIYADKLAKEDDDIYQNISDALNAYLIENSLRKRRIASEKLRVDWLNIMTSLQNELVSHCEHIMSEKRSIVIFGEGVIGREFYRRYYDDFNFLAFTDNNSQKIGTRFFGLDVILPEEILKFTDFAVVVCVRDHYEIARQLFNMGIKAFWLNVWEYPDEPRYMDFNGLAWMDFSKFGSLDHNPRRIWLKECATGGSCRAIVKYCEPSDLDLLFTDRYEFDLRNPDDYYAYNTSALVVTQTFDYVADKKRIEIWHGFTIKALWVATHDEKAKSIFRDHVKPQIPNILQICSYSELYSHLFSCCISGMCADKYAITGIPRNDYLFRTNGKEMIERLFPDCIGKKLIIYAPTFRESESYAYHSLDNGAFFAWDDYDINKLDEFLRNRGIVLLVKMHHIELKQYNIRETEHIKVVSEYLLRANGLHFYEILSGANALISDYSSIWVDYLLLGRPIIFAIRDLEDYKKLHGLMVDPFDAWAPGEIATDMEHLMIAIGAALYEDDQYAEKRKILTHLYHKYLDGNSSARVLDIINQQLNMALKKGSKNE